MFIPSLLGPTDLPKARSWMTMPSMRMPAERMKAFSDLLSRLSP